MSRPRVRAAGGVVVRWDGGALEVVLIHRPKRRDWSFPKGKVEPGETDQACAVREVGEETGLQCVLVDELPSTFYVDRKGRDKIVRYWLMHRVTGVAVARHEVGAVRWVSLAEAAELLTYDRDRALLAHVSPRARRPPALAGDPAR
jgi:8-oxo-dGTP diphosphatase